jgi:hypothetical protein
MVVLMDTALAVRSAGKWAQYLADLMVEWMACLLESKSVDRMEFYLAAAKVDLTAVQKEK